MIFHMDRSRNNSGRNRVKIIRKGKCRVQSTGRRWKKGGTIDNYHVKLYL